MGRVFQGFRAALVLLLAATIFNGGSPARAEAQAAHTPLITGLEDWGAPPANDSAQAPPPAPVPYAGWQRSFPGSNYGYVLTASDDMLVFDLKSALGGYRLDDGAEIWLSGTQDHPYYFAQCEAGVAYISAWEEEVLALDMATGKFLWNAKHCKLLAVSPGGEYVSYYGAVADIDELPNIALLDCATGEQLWFKDTSGARQDFYWLPLLSPYYAVKQNGVIRVLFPDGKEQYLPSPRQAWITRFVYGPDWLIAAEEPITDWDAESDEEVNRLFMPKIIDPATGQQGAAFILTCFNMPVGSVRWRREYLLYQANLFPCSQILVSDSKLVFSTSDNSMSPVSLSDGKEAESPLAAVVSDRNYCLIDSAQRVYYLTDPDPAVGRLQKLDLTTGESEMCFAPEYAVKFSQFTIAGDHLVTWTDIDGVPGRSCSTTLTVYRLGPDGLPVPGKMAELISLADNQVDADLAR